jgi:hypothetical protein
MRSGNRRRKRTLPTRARRDEVLNAGAGVLDAADFSLRFSPWNRQLQGTRRVFSYRVHAEVVGVPAIAWSLATAKTIFGSSAWVERLGTKTASRADMGNFRVTAWTDDPARLPRSKQLWLAEPLEFDEEDEDLLLPVAALVPQEVALLEYKASIHVMRVEDVGAVGGRHPRGVDRRDHDDAGAGGSAGAPPGGHGPGASSPPSRWPGAGPGADAQRPAGRWGGGRERRVALGRTTEIAPWPVVAVNQGSSAGCAPQLQLHGAGVTSVVPLVSSSRSVDDSASPASPPAPVRSPSGVVADSQEASCARSSPSLQMRPAGNGEDFGPVGLWPRALV